MSIALACAASTIGILALQVWNIHRVAKLREDFEGAAKRPEMLETRPVKGGKIPRRPESDLDAFVDILPDRPRLTNRK